MFGASVVVLCSRIGLMDHLNLMIIANNVRQGENSVYIKIFTINLFKIKILNNYVLKLISWLMRIYILCERFV